MNVRLLAGVLRARAELRSHDGWTRPELLRHQQDALAELRRFAVARSPFYRELHRGLTDAPLEALPVVTKATLMDRFDEVVTDREVRRKDVETYLASSTATSHFRNTYRVVATGGTTGRRGIFLADPAEWRTVLASYSRAYDWAGVHVGLTHRLRMAVVSSVNPSHQSSLVGATVASRFIPTLRLDATQPIDEVVAALNEFRPEAVVAYASMLRVLADEAAAGRLQVRPSALISASEVLTAETRQRARSAFGADVTNVYAATETAGIASECRHGRLHRYEDLVIAEIVDDDNQRVEPGTVGSKLLVTVLFSRTQPLIRYELTDRVAAGAGACPDGLPFALLESVEGRQEDVLTLDGTRVHPNVFHAVLEPLAVTGWQVVQRGGSLRVLLAGSHGVDPAAVRRELGAALARVGVGSIPISVELVHAIPRTALGKAPLVRIDRSSPGGAAA